MNNCENIGCEWCVTYDEDREEWCEFYGVPCFVIDKCRVAEVKGEKK